MSEHPRVFIEEELGARRWTLDHLATAMMRSDDDNWGVHRLALDFYMELGPTDRRFRLGQMAEDLARAFGTSADLFRNLERQWLASPSPATGEPQETWNTCPACGMKWKDEQPIAGVVHRTRLCGQCALVSREGEEHVHGYKRSDDV